MDPLHQRLLTKKRIYLLENLRPPEIMDYFIQEDILTIDEKDEIRAKGVRRLQAEALLDKLPNCGPLAFSVLLDALSRTDQGSVADALMAQVEELKRQEESFAGESTML